MVYFLFLNFLLNCYVFLLNSLQYKCNTLEYIRIKDEEYMRIKNNTKENLYVMKRNTIII